MRYKYLTLFGLIRAQHDQEEHDIQPVDKN